MTSLIEWVNRGTVNGTSLEIHGADRYVLRDGKGVEGRAYFDPRPFVEALATGERGRRSRENRLDG